MSKVLYSLKKDEILVENSEGEIIDFADNKWNRKDKFFKAMFLPLYVVAKTRKAKESKKGQSNAKKS